MQFWLGTHRPSWLGRTDAPLFISLRTLPRRRPARALGEWALDSGGFTELKMFGRWTVGPGEYVERVEQAAEQVGRLRWASPRDWMCEPDMLARTGLSVREHQERTVADLLDLRSRAPHLPVIPVLQGWEPDDYLYCADLYRQAGIDLAAEPLVGLGSVCRRQTTGGIRELVIQLGRDGLRLHGFGMKMTGIAELGYLLASSDSLSWSYDARVTAQRARLKGGRTQMLERCVGKHSSCNGCIDWALHWRERVLRVAAVQQPHLPW